MTTGALRPSESLVGILRARSLTIAVAESLTGGLLVAELIAVPGASEVVLGGVIAYRTELKHSVLGVDATLLRDHGAVHPEVAAQMATGVRSALSIAAGPAHIGISSTGVAGPETQDHHPVGTVYLGFAFGTEVFTVRRQLSGNRAGIRAAAVFESITELIRLLE